MDPIPFAVWSTPLVIIRKDNALLAGWWSCRRRPHLQQPVLFEACRCELLILAIPISSLGLYSVLLYITRPIRVLTRRVELSTKKYEHPRCGCEPASLSLSACGSIRSQLPRHCYSRLLSFGPKPFFLHLKTRFRTEATFCFFSPRRPFAQWKPHHFSARASLTPTACLIAAAPLHRRTALLRHVDVIVTSKSQDRPRPRDSNSPSSWQLGS